MRPNAATRVISLPPRGCGAILLPHSPAAGSGAAATPPAAALAATLMPALAPEAAALIVLVLPYGIEAPGLGDRARRPGIAPRCSRQYNLDEHKTI